MFGRNPTVHVAAQPSFSLSVIYKLPPVRHMPADDSVQLKSWTSLLLLLFLFFSFFSLLEQGEMLFYFSNWSPEQLHAHRSDQFTSPCQLKSSAVYFLWVVWISHHSTPSIPHMHYTAPGRERERQRQRLCWAHKHQLCHHQYGSLRLPAGSISVLNWTHESRCKSEENKD